MCYRRALRATRPLRLLALSKRGRVSIAGGQLQVHVCTRLYGPELRGRHRRMRQEPVQTWLLQEHSRIVQVSRRTTSLTLSLSLFLSLLYISSFDVNCALTRRFPIKRRGRRRNRNWAASSFLFFSFRERYHAQHKFLSPIPNSRIISASHREILGWESILVRRVRSISMFKILLQNTFFYYYCYYVYSFSSNEFLTSVKSSRISSLKLRDDLWIIGEEERLLLRFRDEGSSVYLN